MQIGQPLLLEFNLTGQRCGIKTTLNKMEATYGVTVLKEPMQYVVSAVETSSLYVLDEHGKLLKKITGKALLGHPFNLCSNQLNDIIVSDKLNHCIKILNRNGKLKTSIGHMGTCKDCLFEPAGLCSDQHNNIIVADSGNRCVKLFSKCGKFIRTLADFECYMEKPVNVTLSKDYKHIIILLTGNKPRIVIDDYRPPPNSIVQCIT
ncbi:hypothetical protein HELRODRAFT_160236 [Helobdella robusta]|uniref:Uncharacterized protein n=1 Tax=Helobdella robusta TaxID=6412 RepID=T1EQ04_HELRO|nr:hypothetical protein HELRODRAFT_160236 [Helobdella robusta]ESO06100.1 hypothetical protein HELRODRAFT_160236 [Helobdella robusta]